jgi:acyl-CoA reductase-like NAD-dependent aldehyde dehydrogenase
MRNAVLQIPDQRTVAELRRVLRIAVRQLERADMYLGAVASLEMGDEYAQEAIDTIREDVESLRRHLVDQRARQAM